ncbi:MAG TPA: DUF4340 domain-containing protein [Burkholderiales bacterium]|nr:DUF4340 domain-containing protein [Burkholderiales bacterium]
MSGRSWRTALLAAVVAILAVYVYFKPARGPVQYPVSTLKVQDVRSIRVERPGDAAPLLLERRQDGWYVAAPFAARADALRAHQLLAIAEALSSHRLPAGDLARFELDRPVAWVTLAGQTFSFGLVNAVTREQYVLSGDYVYTLHPRYGAALPARPADAANRQLFAADEAPVRIELREFTVEQRAGKWTLNPAAGAVSQEEFMRWVDEWHLASALRVEPWSRRKPVAEIRVRLKNGRDLTLGVLARQPELVLVRTDEKMQYHLRAEAAKSLFSPPRAEARSEPGQKK